MTSTILKKFSDAARFINSNRLSMRDCVCGAYLNHLSTVQSEELPPQLQLIYDSVKLRLTGVMPHGNIENDEAGFIADDILYLANELRTRHSA